MTEYRPDEVEGYIRLSRQDLAAPGGMEQKWADRKAIARRLAEENGIHLPDDRITCEQESGATIDDRSQFSAILERVKSGKTKVLISPYQDRLGRPDLGDLDRIEKAFLRHGATLITAEWPRGLTFGAKYRAHEGAMFGMQAIMARARLGQDGLKRHETNVSKVRRNHRHSGRAAYGYELAYAPIGTDGRVIPPTDADLADDLAFRDRSGVLRWRRYRTNPAEYPILCEVCRRALAGESWNSIARDLTQRGVPTPGRPDGTPGLAWYTGSLIDLVINPFNAGYLAMRTRRSPDGRDVPLSPSEFVLAEEKGDWPHPLTIDEYYRLVETTERQERGKGQAPVARQGMLTGLLWCAHGSPMVLTQENYRCKCTERHIKHQGVTVNAYRVEMWIRDVVEAILAVLPEEHVQPKPSRSRDRAVLHSELAAARQSEEKAARVVDNLLSDPEAFIGVMEEKGYSAALDRAEKQRREAQARREEVERELRRPDAPAALPFLRRLREHYRETWADTPAAAKREVVKLLVERIDLEPVPAGYRFVRGARLTLWSWIDDYAEPRPNLPRFPLPLPGRPRAR